MVGLVIEEMDQQETQAARESNAFGVGVGNRCDQSRFCKAADPALDDAIDQLALHCKLGE